MQNYHKQNCPPSRIRKTETKIGISSVIRTINDIHDVKKKKIKKKRRKKNKALIFVIHTRWSRTRTHRIRRKKVDCLSAAGYDNRWTVMRINSRRVEKSWIGRFFSARYTPRFANKQTVSTRRLSPFDPAPLDYIRVEKKRRKREGEIRRGRMQT